MFVPKLIGLAALSAALMTSAAFAITPLTDKQQQVKNQIAQQLGDEAHGRRRIIGRVGASRSAAPRCASP